MSTFYVCTPIYVETDISYVLCKTNKEMSHEKLLLTPNFAFLHTNKQDWFFVKRLCERLELQDLSMKVSIRIF
jgi:hypothetical protein